jgi:cobyrinic acid a,c-diamide synthase
MNVNGLSRSVPRVIISGVSSGVGKSLIMTGIVSHLRQQRVGVSCCVVGSALHQGLIYNRLSRRYSHTLDRTLLDADRVFQTLAQAQIGADLLLIDGRGGMYDGSAPGDLFGSDADLAALTKTPLVLVVDVEGFSHSIAALIKGYSEFDTKGFIQGIIANRIPILEGDSGSSNQTLRALNEHLDTCGLPRFMGGVPVAPFESPIPPSVCSQYENVTSIARDFFLDAAYLVSQHINLEEIQAIAALAEPISESYSELTASLRNCRVAVTDDSCFNIGYQDNLAWLSYLGAELVPFSPLTDRELPRRIGGVYVTGAYLHSYGQELSKNESIRNALARFVDSGGALFSEGAGTAFLCKSFQLKVGGPSLPGVGIVPAEAVPTPHEQTVIAASMVEDTILGPPGTVIRGISTGEWNVRGLMVGNERSLVNVSRITAPDGRSLSGAFSPTAQSVSTFHLLHFGSNPEVARAFVHAASVKPITGSSQEEEN